MEIKTQLKKIGGSLGICVAIPKQFIDENSFLIDQEIIIDIKKKLKIKDIFGISDLKGKIDVKELHKETDKGWEDD